MPRFIVAAVTAVVAAALAVGAAIGIVAILNSPPDQPNVPLVTFPTAEAEPTGGSTAPAAGAKDDKGDTDDKDGTSDADRKAGPDATAEPDREAGAEPGER